MFILLPKAGAHLNPVDFYYGRKLFLHQPAHSAFGARQPHRVGWSFIGSFVQIVVLELVRPPNAKERRALPPLPRPTGILFALSPRLCHTFFIM